MNLSVMTKRNVPMGIIVACTFACIVTAVNTRVLIENSAAMIWSVFTDDVKQNQKEVQVRLLFRIAACQLSIIGDHGVYATRLFSYLLLMSLKVAYKLHSPWEDLTNLTLSSKIGRLSSLTKLCNKFISQYFLPSKL